jgi:hypothetical protein
VLKRCFSQVNFQFLTHQERSKEFRKNLIATAKNFKFSQDLMKEYSMDSYGKLILESDELVKYFQK